MDLNSIEEIKSSHCGYKFYEVIMMLYKVHKFHIGKRIDASELERYLNDLDGEIISIFPNLVPKFQLMGATAGYDTLIIVEKTLG